jgi:protease-4
MTTRSKQIVLACVLVVFLVIVPLIAITSWIPVSPSIAGDAAVVIEIGGDMLEYHPSFSPGLIFGRRELTLTDVLTAVDAAARDPKAKAIVLKIYPSEAGIAKCEELKGAIDRFRKSGKAVIAFSPILTGHAYLIACAADSIFMPPAGYLIIPGPASSATFLRGTFDKLGIRPNIHRIEDYKSAAEMYTERKRTPASRAMTEWLLGDIFEKYVADIATSRDQSADAVLMWVNRGLFSPARALENGLIDGIRHWDEIEALFESRDVKLVAAHEYLRTRHAAQSLEGPKIAVVHAQGIIMMGESGYDPMSGLTMGSQTIIDELRKVRDDKTIKAVILRVDSPGGDGIAGDMISREVEITAAEKPVIVSMSDVAASGGYEISYRADQIVAMPGSITGSIGSITGKMNMRGFYDKLGITKDEIGTGRNSLIYSDYRDFSQEEWEVIKEEHWQFYRGWIEDIARFRGMTADSIDALGRGRVWTGNQAVSNGLIDGIGDLHRAVGIACEQAKIADSTRVVLVHYPKKLGFLQEILSRNILENVVSYAIHQALFGNEASRSGLFIQHLWSGETIQ